jgi:putative ABC transport system permease protein
MFRRLTRHFAAGLIDNDLIADSQDQHEAIAGIVATLLVVSGAVALMFLGKYNSILQVVNGRVQRAPDQTLADKLAMALDDKALLLGGAMLIMGLVIAFFWDVLALDERDLAVMGPLPVRPSTVLAAKAAAVTGAAVVVAATLNALPAALFPIVLLLKAPVGPLDVMRGMLAHFLAGLAACAFVFLALSSLRGLAGLFGTRSLMRRALPVAQFALVLGFLSVLFALPVLAGKTRLAIESGAGWVMWSPPLWFLGLEEVLIGRTEAVFGTLARIAVTALALSIAGAGVVHALGLRLRTHRLGAGAGSPASMAGRLLSSSVERLARLLSTDGRVRASFVFTARTLTRNARHRLYLAGSLGVGLAVAGATLASAAAGLGFGSEAFSLKYMGLAAQLNLIFFVVIGLRVAAGIPADLDAGWVFRFLATPARERHVAGTRGAIFFVAILPILIVLAPLHAWLWGGYTALVHFAFGVVVALGLLEIVFTDYARMPFVSAFTTGRAELSPRLSLYVLGYVLFAYATPALEQFLIDRTALFYAWVAMVLLVVGCFVRSLARGPRRDHVPIFDGAPRELEQFGLWNIVHAAQRDATAMPDRTLAPAPLFQSIGRDVSPRVETTRRSWQSVANQLRLDLVYASRRLRANRGFTAFAVVTLAVGIGATTGVYSVIYSTVLKPLPVRDVASLVNVYHATPLYGTRWYWTLSLADFEDLRKTQTVFSSMVARAPFGQVVIAGGAGEKARGEAVSGDYFAMLGIQPLAGRLLQDADDQRGAPSVAVIDEQMWRRRFDRRADIAGQVIRMSGQDFVIVGVAPADFHGVESPNVAPTAVWVPLASSALLLGPAGIPVDSHGDREHRWLVAQGRLAPGRTITEARAELRVIAARLDESHPIGRDLPANFRSPPYVSRPWVALPAADRLVSEQADPIMLRMARLTMIAVTLVLLVACTNLANLTLARGVSRKREIAVRLALGASRAQAVREQLVESAIVTVLGGLAAFVAARALTVFASGTALRLGAWLSVDVTPTLDLSTAIAGAAAMVLALIVFGLVPALQLTRANVSLSGGTAVASGVRWRGRGLLIATQVAVSVALVTLASLCARHIVATSSRETGIDLERLALVRFDFRLQGWTEARATRALERLAGEVSRQDGIEAVALLSSMPLRGPGVSASVTTPDRPFTPKYHGQRVTWVAATPAIFRTLGIPVVAGRGFDERDLLGTLRTVVLSESAARKLFASTDVIGRQVLRRRATGGRDGADVLTVLGIARDTDGGAAGRGEDVAYVPFAQSYEPSVTIAARTARSPDAAVMTIKDLTRRLEPEMAVIDSATGGDVNGVENVAFEIMGAMSGLLGVIAMMLAMAGLYGVLSYVVAQRTHEIGVRIALGAGARQITRLVLVDGIRPVVEGLVMGLVVADLVEMATRPALTKPLPAIDASVMALVPIPFLVAALIACYLPTRRATSVDPNVALRHS